MTPHQGLAYVVVTHLPAKHESHLAELIGNVTPLAVTQAESGQPVEAGHVYIIPPGMLMSIEGGKLALAPLPPRTPMPKPIDFFMVALADDLGDNSVGIVLSGTAHDGTAGLKAIRAAGGLTLVQSPTTAEFPGMPNSAIAAGIADQVLAPKDMPAALVEYLGHVPLDLEPPSTPPGTPAAPGLALIEGSGDPLLTVLRLIQIRTGHDFRWYRPAMLQRRLRRRMGLRKLDHVSDYITLLEESNDELDILKNEFLIGVTDFFRDPQAWDELASTVIPALVSARLQDDAPIRVWTPGCATGEESYSIAMLLLEQLEGKVDPQRIQVFGTDIDLNALGAARAGTYPSSIVTTVSAERLARFFDRRGDHYVARKVLRETILFAPQNLVRDTPFSRLDMVLCRNLLIYFKPELQQRVFELFHFALKPSGMLLLGKTESIGSEAALFEPASRSIRLFRRIGTRAHLPRGFGGGKGGVLDQRAPGAQLASSQHSALEFVRGQLDGRAVTAAVLVDREGRALYFHGDTGPFVQLHGNASLDLSALVQPALRVRVRAALRLALGEGTAAASDIALHIDGESRRVHLEAEPVTAFGAQGLALVMFSAAPAKAVDAGDDKTAPPIAFAELTREYEETRRELAAALADAERSNEELRTGNEESLALNEELQSSNEELESSKEELESLNEELSSVNSQLEEKVSELALSNDDLGNLMTSTRMATILLDADLRIRRFTPAASEVFSLQPGDEGRRLSDISSRVTDPAFAGDLRRVHAAPDGIAAEVESPAGKTFLRRILPYRTHAEKIEGAVVTFTDVTMLRDATQRARELVAVLQDSNDAIIVYDLDATILAWNGGAERIYGHPRDTMVGTSLYALLPQASRAAAVDLVTRARTTGKAATEVAERLARDGRPVSVSITVSALRDASGAIYALLSTERDITHQLRAESEMYFRRLADRIPALLRVEDVNGFAQFVNQPCCVFTGRPRDALLGEGWLQFVHPEDRQRFVAECATALSQQVRLETDIRMRRADGVFRWMRSVKVPYFGAHEAFAGYIGLMLDVHDHKLAESALRDADRRKDDFLAMLGHELRNPLAPIRNAVAVIGRAPATDAQTSWAINLIGRQTELLAKLLDDLLDVARISRGKVVLEKAPVELAVLVQRAVEICQPLVDSRRQQLTINVPGEPLVVEGDLLRLTQVLANLLSNAAKYTDEGGRIWLAVERDGEVVKIRVRDTGMGIQQEMLAIVFDPFTQADPTLDRSRGGLGLGLTLVKQLVGLHGGSVQAHSAGLGQGSQFTVRLPLLPWQASAPATVPLADKALPSGACRVLLVDDNRDAIESLAMLMRMDGHEVSLAFDGNEALVVAKRCRPQIVILDVGLPGLDGYQVARRLRGAKATAKVKLIALTGYGQPEDVARAHAAGFDHHFVKPVDPQAILDMAVYPPDTGSAAAG